MRTPHPADPAFLAVYPALLRHARIVLGGDSGPTHMAHTLGTPILMVMGPTDPERHGPYNAPHLALWKELPCSFCHRRLDSTKGCLLALHPDRVAARAVEVLEGRSGSSVSGQPATPTRG
jgi:ADP-heptose:LPS heptosyltransferase